MTDLEKPQVQNHFSTEALLGNIGVIYPKQFLHGMSDTELRATHGLWETTLARFLVSPRMIEKALSILPEKHPSYPPTVGEFLMICNELNTARPEHRDVGPLALRYDGNSEIAQKAIDEMKKLVKAKTTEHVI